MSWHNHKKICSQKSQPWSNIFGLLQLWMLLVNAPSHLREELKLCSTMTQSWMKHCMMLNTYNKTLGELSLKQIVNEFCRVIKRDWTHLENLFRRTCLSILLQRCQWQKRLFNKFLCFFFWLFLWESAAINLYEFLEGFFTQLRCLK